MENKKCIILHSLIVAITLALMAPPAEGRGYLWLLLGPSAGLIEEGVAGDGFVYGADATIGWTHDNPGDIISLAMPRFWMSGGFRKCPEGRGTMLPYAEAGGWYVISFGAGYTRIVGGDAGGEGYHLFLGLPIPFRVSDNDGHGLVIEPYLRHNRIGSERFNEFGIMLKYGFGFLRADWL